MGGVLRIEDAETLVLLDLEKDLEEGFFREEEEAEAGRVGGREIGGYRDGGDGDGDTARVSEPEFLEEDHGTGVGLDFQGFDLGGGVGDQEGEDEEGQSEEVVGMSHLGGCEGGDRWWGWYRCKSGKITSFSLSFSFSLFGSLEVSLSESGNEAGVGWFVQPFFVFFLFKLVKPRVRSKQRLMSSNLVNNILTLIKP